MPCNKPIDLQGLCDIIISRGLFHGILFLSDRNSVPYIIKKLFLYLIKHSLLIEIKPVPCIYSMRNNMRGRHFKAAQQACQCPLLEHLSESVFRMLYMQGTGVITPCPSKCTPLRCNTCRHGSYFINRDKISALHIQYEKQYVRHGIY